MAKSRADLVNKLIGFVSDVDEFHSTRMDYDERLVEQRKLFKKAERINAALKEAGFKRRVVSPEEVF